MPSKEDVTMLPVYIQPLGAAMILMNIQLLIKIDIRAMTLAAL